MNEPGMGSRFVFAEAPLRVYWELTRACDLTCRHCRAEAIPSRDPDELTTAEAFRLLDELAKSGTPPPHVIFTGGDPLKRPDLLALVERAVGVGLPVSVAPSATGVLAWELIQALKAAGVEAPGSVGLPATASQPCWAPGEGLHSLGGGRGPARYVTAVRWGLLWPSYVLPP